MARSRPSLQAPGTPSGHKSRAPSARRAERTDSGKAGRVWARELNAAWDPCIVTLDGGGIRGYSSLLIFKALMHEVWKWEVKLEEEERLHGSQMVQLPTIDTRDERRGRPGNRTPDYDVQTEAELDGVLSRRRAGELRDSVIGAEQQDATKPSMSSPFAATISSDESDDNKMSGADAVSSRSNRPAVDQIHTTVKEEDLLPCHYFDFMYGTSTGGLIAMMLGRLRMTVEECLQIYRKVGDDLFGRKRSLMLHSTKFYHKPLEKAVQELVGSRCHEHEKCNGRDDLHPWDPDFDEKTSMPFDVHEARVCQTCCLTATHNGSVTEAYLLRSYPHYYGDDVDNYVKGYNDGADKLAVWQVTRATSAAPFYFEALEAEVDGRKMIFKDGGIRQNNPSSTAWTEFMAMYKGTPADPALLLSIGTGRPDMTRDGFAETWPGPFGHLRIVRRILDIFAVTQNLLVKYTEGESRHEDMIKRAKGENKWYKRLNVSSGLEGMSLDSWDNGEWNGQRNIAGGASLTRMENAVRVYLERDFDYAFDTYAPPSTMLAQAAEKLVRQRRAREAEGGVKWDTFAGKYLHQPKAANGHAR